MTSLSKRLTQAVNGWASTVDRQGRAGAARTFQVAMSDRLNDHKAGGKAGASYRALLTYLSGQSEPTLEWLRLAAEVLDVRLGWLLLGEKPVRPGAVPAGVVRTHAPVVQHLTGEQGERLMELLVGRLADAQPAGTDPATAEDLGLFADALFRNVFFTWGAVTGGGEKADFERFFFAWVAAMLAAVPRPGEGQRLQDVARKLPQGEWPSAQEDTDA